MSDTEIAFVFDKNQGLIETRVPRTNGGASVTIVGTLSASLLQGAGSGGGGGGSFPLDPVPTLGSFIVTDSDGNPTTSSTHSITTGGSNGIGIATTSTTNGGLNITTTTGYNQGIDIVAQGGINYGIDITSTTGVNHGINITTTNSGTNHGLNITTTTATNYGIDITSTNGTNYGIDIATTTGYNQGIDIVVQGGINYGIDITASGYGYNHGINITSAEGLNYGITIATTGGGTNQGLTITGGGGSVTVDGVDIAAVANNAKAPPLAQIFVNDPRTLVASDAGTIIPINANANAINIPIDASLALPNAAFVCEVYVLSVAGGAATFSGTNGVVITYHGSDPGVTPLAAGDWCKVVVISSTEAHVFVYPAL